MDKEIVKRVFQYAKKYGKDVYAVVSNMSIAVERRDFLQQTSCFVCNQQEMGILFSDDYSEKTPEELKTILQTRVEKLNVQIKEAAASGQSTAILEKTKKSYEETIKKIENGEIGEKKEEKVEVKEAEKKEEKPATKPATKPVAKPATKPATKPESPVTKKTTKMTKTAPKKTEKPAKTETPKSEKKAETKKPKEKKEKKEKKGQQ